MKGIRSMFRLFRLRAEDAARDVDEELAFHVHMREARLRAAGMSAVDASSEARKRFGNYDAIRSECVDETQAGFRHDRVGLFLDELARDVTVAIRSLRRSKAFTLAVVATLGLGIGVNEVMYALLNATILRPVAGVANPEGVFEMSESVAYPEYRELRERTPNAALAAMSERRVAIGTADNIDHADAAFVSGNFFATLGVVPVLGRSFVDADDTPGVSNVVVLSHAYWSRQFGGDRSVLGRTLIVNGVPVTIIGVVSDGFRGVRLGSKPVAWLPIHAYQWIAPTSRSVDFESRNWSWLSVIGRRNANASSAQVEEALTNVMLASDPAYPPSEMRKRTRLRSLQAAALSVGTYDAAVRFGFVMTAVVILVLATACANIAGLLLSRAVHRTREIAVRVALGAGRRRLVRQLFTESLVLATLGGVAALALFFGVRSLFERIRLPGGTTGAALDLSIDARFIAVLVALTFATGIVLGVAPAMQSSRIDPASAIKGMSRGRPRRGMFRGLLVSAQVAAALVLLVGTGLFGRALARALAVDLGFDVDHVVALTVDPGLARFDATRALAYYESVQTAVSALPGVRGAAWSGTLPLTLDSDFESARVDGYTPAAGERVRVEYNFVGAEYHTVLGIPMLDGRTFNQADRAGTPDVVVVNATFAKRYFAGRTAVGGRVELFGRMMTIVGVAQDAKYHALNEEARPYAWLAAAQRPGVGSPRLIASVDGDADVMLNAVIAAARRVNPVVPIYDAITLRRRVDEILAPQRAGAWLLGAFGVLALIVAAVGIYGIVAYAVSQRTRELGIRRALGASSLSMVKTVMRQNLTFVLLGVPVGLVGAVMFGRAASQFLFGIQPANALVLAGTSAVVLIIGAVASYVPARAALRTDPLISLRNDQ